jgi:hypothetical protein
MAPSLLDKAAGESLCKATYRRDASLPFYPRDPLPEKPSRVNDRIGTASGFQKRRSPLQPHSVILSQMGHGKADCCICTPYWTTFELSAIDVKAASVGLLDHIVAGLR